MRVATNFVRPAQRMVMPVAATMWAATFTLVALTLWLVRDGHELRGDLPHLQTRLADVEAQKPATQVHLPPRKELLETRARVARINAAAQTKGLPTLALLAELQKQLPRGAWLTSLHQRASAGEVQLVASAWHSDPLSDFLLRLEHDPLFEEVMLLREIPARHPGTSVHYEIRLKEHP